LGNFLTNFTSSRNRDCQIFLSITNENVHKQ
jgi:hypothetical protein